MSKRAILLLATIAIAAGFFGSIIKSVIAPDTKPSVVPNTKTVVQESSVDIDKLKAALDGKLDAATLGGNPASYFAPSSSLASASSSSKLGSLTTLSGYATVAQLNNLILPASSISPGTFGGLTNYSFPANLKLQGGVLQLTPITEAATDKGSIYYDKNADKLYVRGSASWIDLTQQDTNAATVVVAANDSKNKSRADYTATGTNDQATIQAAIDSLPAGGKVVLMKGTFKIGAAIIIKSKLEIVGTGNATKLQLTSPTNVFRYDGGLSGPGAATISDIYVHNMELDGNKSSFSAPSDSDADAGVDSAIKIFDASRVRLADLYIHDTAASFAILLKGIDTGHGINTNPKDVFVSHNVIRNIGLADQNNGAIYSDASNSIIEGNIIDTVIGNGLNIDAATEGSFYNNVIKNVTAPASAQGYAIVTGYGATGIAIVNNEIAGCSKGIANHIGGSSAGVNHIVTGNVLRDSPSARDHAIKMQDNGHTISGNQIRNWAGDGIFITNSQNTTISDNVTGASGKDNSNGIEIQAGSHNTVISGNIIYDMGTASVKGNGITLSSGSTLNNILISGNRMYDSGGNVMDAGVLLYAVPSSSTIQIVNNFVQADSSFPRIKAAGGAAFSSTVKVLRNRGFVTENQGSATIVSGQTQITVNHGLYLTPTSNNITITPTNNLGNASKFWIDNVTSTSFRINVNSDPGATGAAFVWTVQVF